MRRKRGGAWLQPLLFPEVVGAVSVPEELRGQVVTALAQILLSAVRNGAEEQGGTSRESQDQE